MFVGIAAVLLAAALILEAAGRQIMLGRWLALGGLLFLLAAILAPYRPRPDRRCPVSDTPEPPQQHPAVAHPVHLRIRRHRDGMGAVGKANDWLATHLAVVFGVCWTIWVFFIVPLVAYFLPQPIQNHIFFFSSGWIQLFALPLMVYVGNKLQRSSDAQSDVIHQALTHIATIGDQNKQLLEQNTELTAQIHALVNQPKAVPAKRLATPTERSKGEAT